MAAPITAIDALLTACSQHAQDKGVLRVTNVDTKKTGRFYLCNGYVYAAEVDGFTPPYYKRLSALPGLNEFVDINDVISLAGGESAVALPFLLAQRHVTDESIIKAIARDFLLYAATEILSWDRVKVKWNSVSEEDASLISVDGGKILDNIAKRENNVMNVLDDFETDRDSMSAAILHAAPDPNNYLPGTHVEARAVYEALTQTPLSLSEVRDLLGLTEYSSYRALYNLWSYELVTISGLAGGQQSDSTLASYEAQQQQTLEEVSENMTATITETEETPMALGNIFDRNESESAPIPERPRREFASLPARPAAPRFNLPQRNAEPEETSVVEAPEIAEAPALPLIEDIPLPSNEDITLSEEVAEQIYDEDPLAGFDSLYEMPPSVLEEDSPSEPLDVEKEERVEIPEPEETLLPEEENSDEVAAEGRHIAIEETPTVPAPAPAAAPAATGLLAQLQQLIAQASVRKDEIAIEKKNLDASIDILNTEINEYDAIVNSDPMEMPELVALTQETNEISEKIQSLEKEITRLVALLEEKNAEGFTAAANARARQKETAEKRELAIEKIENARQQLAALDTELAELASLPSL